MLKKTNKFRFNVVTQNANGQISISYGVRAKQNVLGNTKVATKPKKRAKVKITMKTEVFDNSVALHLPLDTVSEANNFDHWTKKHKRHDIQKKTVALALNPHRDRITLPCHIKITRLAPRKLDHRDNLPMAMKYIVDHCCAIITGDFRPGRADGDERITVSYEQLQSSKYGVVIEFKY